MAVGIEVQDVLESREVQVVALVMLDRVGLHLPTVLSLQPVVVVPIKTLLAVKAVEQQVVVV
jgi:hypothetical protein